LENPNESLEHRWETNIKIDLKDINCEDVKWIELVRIESNDKLSITAANFFTSQVTISCLKKNELVKVEATS
jgi:hypothetical protein